MELPSDCQEQPCLLAHYGHYPCGVIRVSIISSAGQARKLIWESLRAVTITHASGAFVRQTTWTMDHTALHYAM